MTTADFAAWADEENLRVDQWWELEQARVRLELARGFIAAALVVTAVVAS